MGDLWFQVVPANRGDRERLFNDFRPKLLAEDAAGYETMLTSIPLRTRALRPLLVARYCNRKRRLGLAT